LGVDKDGKEWYQVSLGGSDGSTLSGASVAGKVVGPSFGAAEVPDVIEALLDTYRSERQNGETFIATFKRVGIDTYKAAANQVRHSAAAEFA
jgi:sulfite reductase (NADPH) hemoprotein beta-component